MKNTKSPKAAAKKSVERKNPDGVANQLKRTAAVAALNAEAAKEAASAPEPTPAPAPKVVVAKAKMSPEVRAAKAILKLATLSEQPKSAPVKFLAAIAEPSAEAIEKLIAEAKALKIDLTKGSWQKKLRR